MRFMASNICPKVEKIPRISNGRCYYLRPLGLEKLRHEGGTFIGEDAGGHLCPGMKKGGGKEAVAAFGVDGAIDDPSHLGPPKRTGAHRAGLDGDIERAVCEVLTADGLRGGGDGDHLGVGRRIMQPLSHVVATADDASLAGDDGTDGDFPLGQGFLGLAEGLTHVFFVQFHQDKNEAGLGRSA